MRQVRQPTMGGTRQANRPAAYRKGVIIGFSQAQGANFHCQPTGRQLAHTQMLDWLADHLPARS
jgi:hypothetical protein